MNTKFLSTVTLTAALLAPGAFAQDNAADAAAPADYPAGTVASTPAPNQTIFVPRLPGAQELSNAAGAQQGVSIERIEQTDSQVTVIYKFSNGQTNTVAYQLLPAANTTAPAVQSSPRVVLTTPPPTVVYQSGPRVVYYSDPYYYPYSYSPGYYWPPVSLSLGLGYIWHGGYYGGGGDRRGGGYHGGGGHRGGGHWHH